MSEKTFGEKRIRTDFNPSEKSNVQTIKDKTAELINILEDFRNDENITDAETHRLISIAQTSFEEAAMWGVKAVTSKK